MHPMSVEGVFDEDSADFPVIHPNVVGPFYPCLDSVVCQVIPKTKRYRVRD